MSPYTSPEASKRTTRYAEFGYELDSKQCCRLLESNVRLAESVECDRLD